MVKRWKEVDTTMKILIVILFSSLNKLQFQKFYLIKNELKRNEQN